MFVLQSVECQGLLCRSGLLVAMKHTLGSFHGRPTFASQDTSVGAYWSAGGMWQLQHIAFTGEQNSTAVLLLLYCKMLCWMYNYTVHINYCSVTEYLLL